MWSLLYLVIRALVRLFVRSGQADRDGGAKDLEILVLRHQLRVLQRTAGRPQLRPVDRVLLAAASRAIPRDRWVRGDRKPGFRHAARPSYSWMSPSSRSRRRMWRGSTGIGSPAATSGGARPTAR